MIADLQSMVLLKEKAHCRFGEKGDTGLFILIPYDTRDFDQLVTQVTPERVSQWFGGVPKSQIRCIPCAQLGAMVVVVRGSLDGGVTTSLALDAHGKTRSGYLLGMSVPWTSSPTDH